MAKAPSKAEKSADKTTDDTPFTIVGIGASAGGVEALSIFFDAMPADSGAAFVVVLHLDPNHESRMAELLASRTTMPVVEIEDGMRVVPDHVYVIAPNQTLTLDGDLLQLTEPDEPRGHRFPVDEFFFSLAEENRERAVAIILSGTGQNGTEGLKRIKSEGGMILVQSPDSAKFDGMPRSAISADLADHVLPPGEMPEVLSKYLSHGYVAHPEGAAMDTNGAQVTLDKVLEVVHAQSGTDFRAYKRSTLGRRVHRRLGLRNIATMDDYVKELRANKDEVAALLKDMMISVTGFFRDPDAWKALREQAIAPLVAQRETGGALRIWVPGCSTGEEAYSVAMLAVTHSESAGKKLDVKIFATDAQEENLRKARDGIYPEAAVAAIPNDLRRRFFGKLDGSYQVKPELRDLIAFAPQNLLRDPPFSRMDLISCRNLLIYIEPKMQQRLIALAHFALREGGYLFLGNAETVGRNDDLFETVSKKWRIYRRIGPTRHDIVDFPVAGRVRRDVDPQDAPPPEHAPAAADMARRALIEQYAPASVLIDQKHRVLYFHGRTGDYLEQPSGEPTKDLLAMARDGLGAKLRAAIREAGGGKRVVAEARIRHSATSSPVTLTVTPIAQTGGEHLLVSFEPAPDGEDKADTRLEADPSAGERALQEELQSARSELQSTVEQMETANEELKASNEEATSMNEELQSTNEELETSKEELQSFNEELHTVNNQLQHKIRELEDLSNDLNNLLTGTDIATLFLDTNLHIKLYSPGTKDLFDLVTSDIGRPVGHFARKFADENLLADAETALSKLSTIEAQVESGAGRWYLRRVLPYRTQDNRIEGIVVTFTDITERTRAAEAVNEERLYAEAIVETVRQPLLVLDGNLRVQTANDAFYRIFEVGEQDTEGRLIHELGNGQWDIPRLRALLAEVLTEDRAFNDIEVEHDFRSIGKRSVLLNGRKLARGGGRDDLILLAIEDITERRQGESAVRASEQRLKDLIAALPGAVYTTDAGGLITSYNPAATELWGRAPELGTDEWCGSWEMYQPDGTPLPHDECPMAIALKEKRAIHGAEAVAVRPDGVRVPFLAYPTPLRDVSGEVTGAVNMLVDITERKSAEVAAERLAAIVEFSDDAIIGKDLDGVITDWNKGAQKLFGYAAGDIVGKSITTLIPRERLNEEAEILAKIRRGEHIDHFETVRLCEDGEPVWVSLTISPLKDAAGKIIGASKIARDITERRRADEHRQILIGELNHRVKNVMATVQAVATQTLSSAANMNDAREAFGARLIALAKAHDVLTRENWDGADLRGIVDEVVEPHSGEDRFRIEGPPVRLAPAPALSFAMALHELTTNASKYGALSNPDGRVDITWGIEGNGGEPRLQLRWSEHDGPPVAAPKRKGFGSRLIERALAAELGGTVSVAYEPAGIVCTIDAPLPADGGQAGVRDQDQKS